MQELPSLYSALAITVVVLLLILIWSRGRAGTDMLRMRTLAGIYESNPTALAAVAADAPANPVTYANAAFARSVGLAPDAVIGRSYWELMLTSEKQAGAQSLRNLIDTGKPGQAVVLRNHSDGGTIWNSIHVAPVDACDLRAGRWRCVDAHGTGRLCVLAHHDITDSRRYQSELERDASHDALTGLANRTLLRRRLREAISHADVTGHQIWVIFLDLDRFKSINDSLGHKAGDQLLRILAERLSHIVREHDTVARLGGDEFVILMRETEQYTMSTAAVTRIIESVAEPVAVEGHELVVTCSVGIAVSPENGIDPEQLVACADVAMYSAKQHGRNTFQFYEPELNERALPRLVMESALRTAVERDQFALHYQPQVDLKTGCIVGMEALIHWRHPTLGVVPPTEFIGLAEETGIIVTIGEWVLREACRQNKAWQDAGLGHLRVAVNLSPRQFADPQLVATIDCILRETGLAPRYLEIELTENLIMTEIARAVDILAELKSHGIQLSIDDFGTGYSSLSYLKRFPIDVLKIDRTFVKDIGQDADDEAIVKSIISLAHSLKLHVIAEGVETPEQLAFLAEHGCDEFQGFYYSRPLAPQVFARMLSEQRPVRASAHVLH